jgi:hypothetical protein
MNAAGMGGRPPGQAKTGGRQKGTPNRSTLVLRQKLAELGCDPVAELVTIARDPKTNIGQRVDIYSSFLRYTHPLPKPVGSSDDDNIGDEPEITLDDALAWAHYMIKNFDSNPSKKESDSVAQETDSNPESTEENIESEN